MINKVKISELEESQEYAGSYIPASLPDGRTVKLKADGVSALSRDVTDLFYSGRSGLDVTTLEPGKYRLTARRILSSDPVYPTGSTSIVEVFEINDPAIESKNGISAFLTGFCKINATGKIIPHSGFSVLKFEKNAWSEVSPDTSDISFEDVGDNWWNIMQDGKLVLTVQAEEGFDAFVASYNTRVADIEDTISGINDDINNIENELDNAKADIALLHNYDDTNIKKDISALTDNLVKKLNTVDFNAKVSEIDGSLIVKADKTELDNKYNTGLISSYADYLDKINNHKLGIYASECGIKLYDLADKYIGYIPDGSEFNIIFSPSVFGLRLECLDSFYNENNVFVGRMNALVYELDDTAEPYCFKAKVRIIDYGNSGNSIPYECDYGKLLLSTGNGISEWVNIEDMLSYGIEIDKTISSTSVKRIGNMSYHATLPIQSKMRRCLLKDDGTVNYYLGANNSFLKEDGSEANLNGKDGQVMVEIPAHYRKFELNGTKYRCMLSEYPLPGFHYVPLAYRSAYEATIDRTIVATPKLCSVANTTIAFRGGNNNETWDNTYRSLLGRPATGISLTNFRSYARNRGNAGLNGAGWNCDVYEVQKTCYWLYSVEYANFNCQLPYTAALTSEWYKRGGLVDGVTTLNSSLWSSFNGYNPFIPCGYTNILGNRTGIADFAMPSEYGSLTVLVPSYRGLENPFGHVWSWTDGCKCNIQSNDGGGLSEFFTCGDPSNFQDTDYVKYIKRGELPRSEGYVKDMMIGVFGENMPTQLGGSSSTYFSDYFFTSIPASGENQLGVLFGGSAASGATAGFAFAFTSYSATYTSPTVGSRLCFLPQ